VIKWKEEKDGQEQGPEVRYMGRDELEERTVKGVVEAGDRELDKYGRCYDNSS